jgi:putative Holliday junction resolvase
MQTKLKHLMALDVGDRRIGVAVAEEDVRFPRPHTTLEQSSNVFDEIAAIAKEHDATVMVVGLPRNLQGEATEQTRTVEAFAKALESRLSVPIAWQDEALTSVKAEEELASRGKAYNKADVDALAATYILEDYIAEHPNVAKNKYV